MRKSTKQCGTAALLALAWLVTGPAAQAQDPVDPRGSVAATETARRAAEDAASAAVAARDETTAAASRATLAAERALRSAALSQDAAAGSVMTPGLGPNCTPGTDPTTRFRRGGSGDRRCVVLHLRAQRQQTLMLTETSRAADWPELLTSASLLGDYYLARSGRQQAVMDFGATTTGIGALGAGLSGPAGAHTTALWGYGALFGVVLVSFTGSQPNRDLHYAGHLGVQYVVNRYVILNNRVVILKALQTESAGSVAAACAATATSAAIGDNLTKVERWDSGDDKSAFLPMLRQMNDACSRLHAGEIEFGRAVRLADRSRLEWPAGFASDLLALDDAIAQRDARLRLTPNSAISAAAVAPLRVIDSLISGENTQEAVNRVRINALLDDMTVNLRPMAIPSSVGTIDGTFPSMAEIRDRSARTGRANPPTNRNPTDDDIRDIAAWIDARRMLLEKARVAHNDQAFFASELHAAAQRSLLKFDYVVDTGIAQLSLEEPAATPPSSAGKTDGRQVQPPSPG
jgi:hypothetical protein